MKFILTLFLSCIVLNFHSIAQSLPQPVFDDKSVELSGDKPSVIKYFYKGKMVLWKTIQDGSMMYLPGQAIGTTEDSAYLYFFPDKQVLYRFRQNSYSVQTYLKNSCVSRLEKYENKKLVEKGQYFLEKDPGYAPNILNAAPIPFGKWNYYDQQGTIVKTKDYTTGKLTGGNINFLKNQQPFIKAADSILKTYFRNVFAGHIRVNANKSTFIFNGRSCNGFGDRIEDSVLNTPITEASLVYDFILNDTIRNRSIAIAIDNKRNIKRTTWHEPIIIGLPITTFSPGILDYKKLLTSAAKHGILNNHRLYTMFKYNPDNSDRHTGSYSIEFYYDKDDNPSLNAENITYKYLSINLHTGKEVYKENFKLQFATIGGLEDQ